jgi:hypothetical protein
MNARGPAMQACSACSALARSLAWYRTVRAAWPGHPAHPASPSEARACLQAIPLTTAHTRQPTEREMPKKPCVDPNRRKAALTLAALAGAALPWPRAGAAAPVTGAAQPRTDRRMAQLIGSNGWPFEESDIGIWRSMGLTWGRDSVGPGISGPNHTVMEIDRTGPGFNADLPPILLRNNRNGIKSLLLLGYKRYSTPPFNLKYFQIWNEAAGPLSGGDPQATFWHGPNFHRDPRRAAPYQQAMQDYVERIHLPAARIIRKYGAYIVYGGWPDQGGLDNYCTWLEYTSPVQRTRMIDWVDYLDIHYLGTGDMETLYQRYVAKGKARGIWQTEIGDRYMADPHYLPTFYFDLAVWALGRAWDDPDKYVAMIYHWDGTEPFRLTVRGQPRRLTVSGNSLTVRPAGSRRFLTRWTRTARRPYRRCSPTAASCCRC